MISKRTTETELSACAVSVLLGKKGSCHQLSFSRKSGLLSCDEQLQDELEFIQYSSVCFDFGGTGAIICLHHKIYFLQQFQTEQRTCYDPFSTHKTKVKLWRHLLTLEDFKSFPFVKSVPDKKCCAHCYEWFKLQKEDQDVNDSDISEPANMDLVDFNNSVFFFGISPIKLSDQQGAVTSAHYVKWKLELMKGKLSSLFRDTFSGDISNSSTKCDDLSKLISDMKQKMKVFNQQEKIANVNYGSWVMEK